MVKSIYICSFLMLMSLYSCEKYARDVTYPDFQQKIVLGCFISPSDSVSYVYINMNNAVFGELDYNLSKILPNGKAYISDGTNEIRLDSCNSGFKFLHKDMAIEPGKTYFIRVEGGNSLKAEATTTVPLERNLNLRVDSFHQSIVEEYGYERTNFFVRLKFTDLPGESNYYFVGGHYTFYGLYDVYDSLGNKSDTPMKIVSTNEFEFNKKLITDIGQDGQEIKFTPKEFSNWGITLDSILVTITIRSINKDFYLYQKTLDSYINTEDPFIEVTPVYSNVKNGLGIFAGFTKESATIRVK